MNPNEIADALGRLDATTEGKLYSDWLEAHEIDVDEAIRAEVVVKASQDLPFIIGLMVGYEIAEARALLSPMPTVIPPMPGRLQ